MTQPSAQILDLHRHFPKADIPAHLMSDHALVWDCKAMIADMLNMVATGQLAELPEHVKANIREANEAAIALGFAPLVFDF